jgi:hypothetical protein
MGAGGAAGRAGAEVGAEIATVRVGVPDAGPRLRFRAFRGLPGFKEVWKPQVDENTQHFRIFHISRVYDAVRYIFMYMRVYVINDGIPIFTKETLNKVWKAWKAWTSIRF